MTRRSNNASADTYLAGARAGEEFPASQVCS
jgi:hypothetical protein